LTIAEAESAAALAMGTLRFVSARLGGKNPSEELRAELEKMRGFMVRVRVKRA